MIKINSLFKAEKKKLYYSKTFWTIAIVIGILSILNTSSYLFNNPLEGLLGSNLVQTTDSIGSSVSIFEAVLGSIDDGVITFIIIFVSIFIGIDFSSGILKNSVSRGFSKKEIYISKLISSIYATIVFLLIAMICSAVIGIIFFEKTPVNVDIILNFAETMATKILLVFAFTSISVLITTIVRNVGLAITVNFLVIRIIPSTIIMIFPSFSKFQISNHLYKLVDASTSSNILMSGLIIALGYIVVSNVIGTFVFAQKDI
ncbi:ABC transporter permease subunit [Clostridium sp.]|uniref:ABC transporter permease subunit n=1 Tax=Clostridium sp. TaxID=1506 RepID=UPI0032165753